MNVKTQHRVDRVIIRSRQLHRQRGNYFLGGLSAVCVCLIVSLFGIFVAVTKGLSPDTPAVGVFGAVLLWSEADAYVLTGVLAFTAGIIITALCLKAQKKKKHSNETTEKKPENEETTVLKKE